MFEGRKRKCTLCSLAMQPHPWVGYTISVNPVANAFVPFFVSSNQPPSAQFHLRKSMSLSQERLSSTGLVLEFNIFSKLVRKQLNCIFYFVFIDLLLFYFCDWQGWARCPHLAQSVFFPFRWTGWNERNFLFCSMIDTSECFSRQIM